MLRAAMRVPDMTLTALQAYNIEKAIAAGQQIEAIKQYREATHCDLAEAKAAIDRISNELREQKPWLFKHTAPPEPKGIRKSVINVKAFTLFMLVDAVIFAGVIYYFFLRDTPSSQRDSTTVTNALETTSAHAKPKRLKLSGKIDTGSFSATLADGERFESLYLDKIADRHYIRRKGSSASRQYDDSLLERKIKTARSQQAATRTPPEGTSTLSIPRGTDAPVIDGILEADAWRDALRLTSDDGSQTTLYAKVVGDWLFIACDAPAERTASGYDQLRVYLHMGLFDTLVNERIHIGRGPGITTIRQTRFHWQGEPPSNDKERWKKYAISDWGLYQYAQGSSSMHSGHRQYEAAIHLGEAALHANTPFPLYTELETDPLRDTNGKFVERQYLGSFGSDAQPLWLYFN